MSEEDPSRSQHTLLPPVPPPLYRTASGTHTRPTPRPRSTRNTNSGKSTHRQFITGKQSTASSFFKGQITEPLCSLIAICRSLLIHSIRNQLFCRCSATTAAPKEGQEETAAQTGSLHKAHWTHLSKGNSLLIDFLLIHAVISC